MIDRGHTVDDLTCNKECFAADIDFNISGRTCELKTDYVINRTGNLFLEDYLVYTDGRYDGGYLRKSKAEYLLYFDIKGSVLYIYPFSELKQYIKENCGYIPIKVRNDGFKKVYGYCLDKDKVEHQIIEVER